MTLFNRGNLGLNDSPAPTREAGGGGVCMWGERDGMSGVALMGASKFGYLQTPRPTGTNGDGRTGTDGHGRHVTACHGAHAMHKFARHAPARHNAALAFVTMLTDYSAFPSWHNMGTTSAS